MTPIDSLVALCKHSDHIVAGAARSGHLKQVHAMFGVAAEEAKCFGEPALAALLLLAMMKASMAGLELSSRILATTIKDTSDEIAIEELVDDEPWS